MKLLPSLKICQSWVVACLSVVSQWGPFHQLRRNVCGGHWPIVWGFSVSPLHHHRHWFPPCRPCSEIFFYSFSLITHTQSILLHLPSQCVLVPQHFVILKISHFLAFMKCLRDGYPALYKRKLLTSVLKQVLDLALPVYQNDLHSICTGNASTNAFVAWLSHPFSFSWHN